MKTSTSIKDFSYDEGEQELTITFINDKQYVYYNVDSKIVEDFKLAESLGHFFIEKIQYTYPYKKL